MRQNSVCRTPVDVHSRANKEERSCKHDQYKEHPGTDEQREEQQQQQRNATFVRHAGDTQDILLEIYFVYVQYGVKNIRHTTPRKDGSLPMLLNSRRFPSGTRKE